MNQSPLTESLKVECPFHIHHVKTFIKQFYVLLIHAINVLIVFSQGANVEIEAVAIVGDVTDG